MGCILWMFFFVWYETLNIIWWFRSHTQMTKCKSFVSYVIYKVTACLLCSFVFTYFMISLAHLLMCDKCFVQAICAGKKWRTGDLLPLLADFDVRDCSTSQTLCGEIVLKVNIFKSAHAFIKRAWPDEGHNSMALLLMPFYLMVESYALVLTGQA